MKTFLLLALIIFSHQFANAAQRCVTDRFGDIFCAHDPNGTAVLDGWGDPVCGVGECIVNKWREARCSQFTGGGVAQSPWGDVKTGAGGCATNRMGEIYCSPVFKGMVATNPWGDVVCQGGCVLGVDAVAGSAQLCDKLQK